MARRDIETDLIPAGTDGLNLVDPEIYLPVTNWVQADNVVYDAFGSTRKRPGVDDLTAFNVAGAQSVRNGYDFWFRSGGAWTRKHLVGSNGKVFYEGGAAYTDITPAGVVLAADTLFQFAALNNYVLIFNDQDSAPWYWNGIAATATELAGGGVLNWRAGVKHRDRIFAYGDPDYSDYISYCDTANPLVWTGGDSGVIPVCEGDGDEVIALSTSIYNWLIVCKGPNHGSVLKLSGNSSTDFAVDPMIEDIRVLNQRCIVSIHGKILLYTDLGLYIVSPSVYTTGSFSSEFVSYIVHPWLKEINWALSDWFSMVYAPQEHCVLVNVSRGATMDTILYYHMRKGQWARWPAIDVCGLWRKKETGSRRQHIMAGGSAGHVWKMFNDIRNDNGVAYSAELMSPRYTLMDPNKPVKQLGEDAAFLELLIFTQPTGAVPITLTYQVDAQAPISVTLTGPATGAPGLLGSTFILGTTVLGGYAPGRGLVTLRHEIDGAAQGQTIQFRLSNATVNDDIAIYGCGMRWTPAGESKERMA